VYRSISLSFFGVPLGTHTDVRLPLFFLSEADPLGCWSFVKRQERLVWTSGMRVFCCHHPLEAHPPPSFRFFMIYLLQASHPKVTGGSIMSPPSERSVSYLDAFFLSLRHLPFPRLTVSVDRFSALWFVFIPRGPNRCVNLVCLAKRRLDSFAGPI